MHPDIISRRGYRERGFMPFGCFGHGERGTTGATDGASAPNSDNDHIERLLPLAYNKTMP